MGFLRGDFDKTERKGDEALSSGDPLRAMQHFRDALRKAERKDAAAAERLREKEQSARVAFLTLKLAEARRFLDDEVIDAAHESLEIAREHLGAKAGAIADEIERLSEEAKKLEARLAPSAPEADLEQLSEIGSPGPLPGVLAPIEEEADDAEERETWGSDSAVIFEQLAAGMPENDREHGLLLGTAFHEGFIAGQRGDAAAALSAFRRAEAEHPDDPLVLEHLALTLDQMGQTSEASATYARALKSDPTRRQARLALASIAAGVDAEAVGGARGAAYWLRTAGTAPAGAAFDDAIALLEDGAQRDPEHAAYYLAAAADVSLAHGRKEQASRYATRALESSNDDPALWHTYAVARELSDDVPEAEKAYDRAARLAGASMFYRAEFAEFALRHNRALEDAEKLIFETCMSCQVAQPMELDAYGLLLTRIQYARGEYKQALQGLDRLLAKGAVKPILKELQRLREEIRERLLEEARAAEAAREAEEFGDDQSPADAEAQAVEDTHSEGQSAGDKPR